MVVRYEEEGDVCYERRSTTIITTTWASDALHRTGSRGSSESYGARYTSISIQTYICILVFAEREVDTRDQPTGPPFFAEYYKQDYSPTPTTTVSGSEIEGDVCLY